MTEKTKVRLQQQARRIAERNKRIIELATREPHLSYREIGRRIGCDRTTVGKALQNAGMGRGRRKRVDKSEVEAVKRLLAEGLTPSEIARKLGMPTGKVFYRLRLAGGVVVVQKDKAPAPWDWRTVVSLEKKGMSTQQAIEHVLSDIWPNRSVKGIESL